MTPVGDIEIEIVFPVAVRGDPAHPVAVRGRTSDLAHLLQAISNEEAITIGNVEKPTATEVEYQDGVTTTVGSFSG